jgi:hypothetical protein
MMVVLLDRPAPYLELLETSSLLEEMCSGIPSHISCQMIRATFFIFHLVANRLSWRVLHRSAKHLFRRCHRKIEMAIDGLRRYVGFVKRITSAKPFCVGNSKGNGVCFNESSQWYTPSGSADEWIRRQCVTSDLNSILHDGVAIK